MAGLGLVAYDSEEEGAGAAPAAPPADPAAPPDAGAGAQAAPPVPVPGAAAKARAKGKVPPLGAAPKSEAKDGGKKRNTDSKLREVLKEIASAKSATAVVQVMRRNLDSFWDIRWGAEALYQIAKRSTARTRKEWADDPQVKQLADKLRAAASNVQPTLSQFGSAGVDIILTALDALRRMHPQEVESQKDALERAIIWLVASDWQHPVHSLARLYWLGAPLTLKGKSKEFSNLLPDKLRSRASELAGTDVALLVAAMQHEGAKDFALLQKVLTRMKAPDAHSGLSATDLVELAEGLQKLGADDEAAIRPLGQEILRRRGELTAYESHRVHEAFRLMKLPLPQVWTQPGASKKRDGAQIVTTTAFKPQDGHEKKRRGNNDVERTSPPRVVRDYKMCSY